MGDNVPNSLTELARFLTTYGPAGLVALLLWLGVYKLPKLQSKGSKDFSWYLCWSLFGLSALSFLFFAFVDILISKQQGGFFYSVPAQMDIIAEEDSFFISKHRGEGNFDNYKWITFQEFPNIILRFFIRQNKRQETVTLDGKTRFEIEPAPVEFVINIDEDHFEDLKKMNLGFNVKWKEGELPVLEDPKQPKLKS
jgi:hypothetical protein